MNTKKANMRQWLLTSRCSIDRRDRWTRSLHTLHSYSPPELSWNTTIYCTDPRQARNSCKRVQKHQTITCAEHVPPQSREQRKGAGMYACMYAFGSGCYLGPTTPLAADDAFAALLNIPRVLSPQTAQRGVFLKRFNAHFWQK
jgi:hypothetical protein